MHILLTDFGSAKIISPEDDVGGNGPGEAGGGGRRNSFVGTAQYVSPEILTNSGSSKASDLWALGCIIYQMVTGIPPFQAQNEYLIFQKVPHLNTRYFISEGGWMFRVQNLIFLILDSKFGVQFP